jgi:hypothetical protein
MNKVLLITTVYRLGEKIYPIIPELSKFCSIDLLRVNEMSYDMRWYGDIDPRMLFEARYIDFIDDVYDAGFESSRLNPSKEMIDFDIKGYDIILYDDDRNRHGVHLLYEQTQNTDCSMIGNVHGNWWFPPKSHITQFYKKAFDYAFVFGQKEKDASENNDYIFTVGIPSNDELKYYERTDDFILVIVNFLGNRDCPFDVQFDENFMKESGLLELQKEYDKRVVFKLKSRADQPYPDKDFQYLASIVPKELDYIVMMDFEDNNQLICGASIVISAPSTFAFKSIQKGIPTILIDGAGITGNFYDYRGLVQLNKKDILNSVEEQIENGRDEEFINYTIEGGLDFNCTETYINKLRNFL